MKNRSLFSILATVTMATILSLGVSLNIIQAEIQEAGASTAYSARQVFQMNRIRYDGGWSNGIATRYQEGAFQDNIWDMSYGRVVLDAESATTYQIGLRYAAGSYPVKVYVNGTMSDYTFPDNGWSNSVYNLNVALNEGKNVFIVAILNWGVINELILPDGVTLLDEDTSGGVYGAGYSDLQNTYLSYTGSGVHDPDAAVYTSELNYDGSSDWRSKAKFDVTASASTKSVDLTYYCKQYTDGVSEVAIAINNNAAFNVSLYEQVEATHSTLSIPTSVLTANGFTTGANKIEIIKPNNNNEKIGLISLTLKDDEVTAYTTTRVEAETATLSGGTIKGAGDLGSGNWSNSSYVGDMGTKTTLTSPSQISSDLSNVNYMSLTYAAANTGVYNIYLRYATGVNCTAYVRANQGSWVTISLPSTSWWDTPRVALASVNMQQGNQTIVITGTTNNGGWMNYDFVDIVQAGSLSADEVAYNYAVFFREQTSAGCTAANVSLIPWSQLKSEYLALSSAEKDAFVDSSDEIILDAKARYQVLINRYPTLAADNWLVDGDNVVVYASSGSMIHDMVNSDSWVLFGMMAIVLASIGIGLVLLRKHRYAI